MTLKFVTELERIDCMEKEAMNEQQAKEELEKRYGTAKKLLEDEDKLEKFLKRLEEKLKVIPKVGDKLSMIPVFASLLKSYVKKEYKEVPLGTIIAILAALIYFVSPIDIIPDTIPVLGYSDDAAVVYACLKLVESDVKEYQEWREKNEAE